VKKIRKIHFVGIKGVGVAPLAIIAKEAGFDVSGSDIDEEFITDEPLKNASIKPLVGFDERNVEGKDLIITTGAHGGFDNPENLKAKQLGIPVLTQGEAVGKFMQGEIFGKKFEGVSVAGSHGKTTTTAMIATVLLENKYDPSFLIGTGHVPSLGSSGHFGKGKFFIAEADEYATEPKFDKTPKLLWQHPKIGVITNIEFDHPDLYSSLDELRQAFLNFSNNISENGILVACLDDEETQKLLREYKRPFVTYGFSKKADYYIEKLSISQDKMFFWVNAKDTSLGEFSVNVTGEHNALNALSTIVVCIELGLSVEQIKKGLNKFTGTKRRYEFIGDITTGASLYDDYAHHPTEIRKTLLAFKKSFPKKKIVCIFQPHTYSRTKSLFEQFVGSFSDADIVILVDIYSSLREEIDNSVSSKLLAENISKVHKNVLYIPKLEDVVEYVGQKRFDKDYILITMGAGNVYKIYNDLVK
jgi:UDP-N-acetylmuramate--alanine ligase